MKPENKTFPPIDEAYVVMKTEDFSLQVWSNARWYERLGYHIVYLMTRVLPGLGPLLRWSVLMEAHHHGWSIQPPKEK